MNWVHIYRRDFATGEATVIATCILTDGRVELQGDEEILARLRQGILMPAMNKTLTTDDGMDFLAALKNEFRSLELVATDVQEGDEVT